MNWLKKITSPGIGTVILVSITFVLLIGGCQTTSDDTTTSQLTGSWEGTLDGKPVFAIFAPDNTIHMAFSDNSGEVSGKISSIIENVGRGTAAVRPYLPVSTGDIVFQLTAGRILGRLNFGTENWALDLHPTPDARHPAQPADVAGRWSLDLARGISDLWVDDTGNLSGSDAVSCNYAGTLRLLSPEWNIYLMNLEVTKKGAAACSAWGNYAGYAMVSGAGLDKTIKFSSSAQEMSGYYLTGAWYATNNLDPVAEVQTFPPAVSVLKGITEVTLDATGSHDQNHDPLTYHWSVAPDNSGVTILDPTRAQTMFTTELPGAYTFTVTVSDGIVETKQSVDVNVAIALERFTDMGNGTVMSNVTSNTNGVPRIWLKDANCYWLMDKVTTSGVPQSVAMLNVSELADMRPAGKPVECSLTDGSRPGDWRLPTKDELFSLVDTRFVSPSLSNALGTAKWSDNDSFSNVRAPYIYWTSTVYDGSNGYFVNFAYGSVGYAVNGNAFFVWPIYDPKP